LTGAWARGLYNTLLWASVPVVGPVLAVRGLVSRKWLPLLPRRLGLQGQPAVRSAVWLHAVSVGEVLATRPLLGALRADELGPVVLSSTTATGVTLARAAVERGDAAASIASPLDFLFAVKRAFDDLEPRAIVLVEAELWPNWLAEAARRGVPVALVNARIGERSFRRYRRASALFRPLIESLAAVGARTDADAQRLAALGVDERRLRVTGDLKFDVEPAARDRSAAREELGVPRDAFVVVAGSTHRGDEEEAILAAFAELKRRRTDAVLVLAPRKPGSMIADAVRRTERRPVELGGLLLLDTLGELKDAYAAADVAFVGGSLSCSGGHNLLEPAAAGVPVLFGPHTHDHAVPARLLVESGGGRCVDDAAGLAAQLTSLADDLDGRRRAGERARSVVAAGRGAARRTLDLLAPVLSGGS